MHEIELQLFSGTQDTRIYVVNVTFMTCKVIQFFFESFFAEKLAVLERHTLPTDFLSPLCACARDNEECRSSVLEKLQHLRNCTCSGCSIVGVDSEWLW